MAQLKNKNKNIQPFYLTVLIIINAVLGLYYVANIYDLLIGKYNYDGWRFGIYMIAADMFFFGLLLAILISKDWRILIICFVNILLHNFGAEGSFSVTITPYLGFFISVVFIIIYLKSLANTSA